MDFTPTELEPMIHPNDRSVPNLIVDTVLGYEGVTIKETLAAAALSLGNKLPDSRDTSAIDAAMAGIRRDKSLGFGRLLSSVPYSNAERITAQKLLSDAVRCMQEDRTVTQKDAERVARAENRSSKAGAIHPTGVAACMAAAAKLNGYNEED